MALKLASKKYPGIYTNELKNGDTAFYINYRDENGVPRRKKVGVNTKQSKFTLKDAYDRLIETKHKLATGEDLPKSLRRKAKVSFEDIYNVYIEWAKQNKKTWKHNDEYVYKKHLSFLSKRSPSSITSQDFEDLKNEKLKEYKPKTVQHILATARHIFNHAIKHNLIPNLSNPIAKGKVRMPKVENQKIGFLTKEQAKEILVFLKDRENPRLYQLTVLLLYTGGRFSEVARLKWSNINFHQKLIYFGPSKDGNARYIKMTKSVHEVLKALKKERVNDLVIPTAYGNKYTIMPKEWQIIVDDFIPGNSVADADRITPHSLRHTHASWLAQSGVDILHIKEQLGHKKIETTMRYSHLIDCDRHEKTLLLEDEKGQP